MKRPSRQLRTILDVGAVASLTDAQLLQRFVVRGGEAGELAFATLVERHGPMVLRVCRGVLRDPHAADDAFQATFLVLVRKAARIRDSERLGNWLHGVALRVAANAHSSRMRRRRHEQGAASNEEAFEREHGSDELCRAIHEEVGRLPERYRAPLILCCLEGESYTAAAHHLGLPMGTIKSRIARGRDRLRDRLVRRGFAPAGAGVSALLATEQASAAVPARLVQITTQAAARVAASPTLALSRLVPVPIATLTDGVLSAMLWTKVKTVATAGAVGLILLGGNAALLARQQNDPHGTQDASADRLVEVERKLDRLLDVLEANSRNQGHADRARTHPDADPFTLPGSRPARNLDSRVEASGDQARIDRRTQSSNPFGQNSSDARHQGASPTDSPPENDRLNRLEHELEELKRRVELLERNSASHDAARGRSSNNLMRR